MGIGLTGLLIIPSLLNGIASGTSHPILQDGIVAQAESMYEYTPEYGTGGPAVGDLYECNNDELTATKIFPENFNDLEGYHTSFNATLCFGSDLGDVDYYCLSLLTESIVCLIITETGDTIYPFFFTTEKYIYGNSGYESGKAYSPYT